MGYRTQGQSCNEEGECYIGGRCDGGITFQPYGLTRPATKTPIFFQESVMWISVELLSPLASGATRTPIVSPADATISHVKDNLSSGNSCDEHSDCTTGVCTSGKCQSTFEEACVTSAF